MKNIKNVQIRELLANDTNVEKYKDFGAFSNKEQMFELIAKVEDNIMDEVKKFHRKVVGNDRYDTSKRYTDEELKKWFYEYWDDSHNRLELLILDYFLLMNRKIYTH